MLAIHRQSLPRLVYHFQQQGILILINELGELFQYVISNIWVVRYELIETIQEYLPLDAFESLES